MFIKDITYQHRRDFNAIYECEHCGTTIKSSGYDDRHFHQNVIPTFKCLTCGMTTDSSYVARSTKYADNEVV